MVKYVDDSTCAVFEICTQNLGSVIQESALIVAKWSKENDMRINTTKTKEMAIGFGKRTVESISNITIDNCHRARWACQSGRRNSVIRHREHAYRHNVEHAYWHNCGKGK